MTRSWRIRPGRSADIVALQAVEIAAAGRFRAIGWNEVADFEPTPPEHLGERVGEGRLAVAEAGGEPVGFASWRPLATVAYLEEIDVRPDWHGKGVGAALIEAVARAAAGAGFAELTLSTFRDVAWNGPWYGRRGFLAIADDAIGPELAAIRARHVAAGLDESLRQFMRRPLVPVRRP
jgi:GNAT superfamily N-acetyltransferase